MATFDRIEARNYRRSYSGGDSKPQLFQCSDGSEWVLKLIGNPQGVRPLAADWVGSVIAAQLGIPIPEPKIVDVGAEALSTAPEDIRLWAKPGPAFGSKLVRESINVLGPAQLTLCSNLSHMGRVAVLDTWIDVPDRKKPDGYWNLLIETSHHGQPTFLAIDQGLAFGNCLYPIAAPPPPDSTVPVRLPEELHPFLDRQEANEALRQMNLISSNELTALLDSLPLEWGILESMRDCIIEYMFSRRPSVESSITQEGLTQ